MQYEEVITFDVKQSIYYGDACIYAGRLFPVTAFNMEQLLCADCRSTQAYQPCGHNLPYIQAE